jgi:low temperature requirement protein LtrA
LAIPVTVTGAAYRSAACVRRYRRAVASGTWRRPMTSRDTDEEHRASTPLELLFDLCFVVAVARAASLLHHAIAAGDAGSAVVSYVLVFFAIWWAWMNFTWFSSAYDNDDVIYRLLTLVQITGVLILAAGVPRAFDHRDFDIVFVGYLVIRTGLVTLWLRAARYDEARRATTLRFAAGEALCMFAWAGAALLGWPIWAFVLAGMAEVAVPVWAEAAEKTPWHPEHIAERFGLFTLIVLGETILASSVAFQAVVDDRTGHATAVLTAVGALLTVFSMWWLYFDRPAAESLASNKVGFPWGYGHYVVFAAAAAVGAGVGVVVDSVTGHAHVSDTAAAAAFTIPVVLFVAAVVFIQTLLFGVHRLRLVVSGAAVLLVAAITFTGQPVLLTGIVLAALVTATFLISARAAPQ